MYGACLPCSAVLHHLGTIWAGVFLGYDRWTQQVAQTCRTNVKGWGIDVFLHDMLCLVGEFAFLLVAS